MLATHDQFSRQMRNRLKTAAMGWGLVRLLQDAGRAEEARTILSSLAAPTEHHRVQESDQFLFSRLEKTARRHCCGCQQV